MSVSIPLLIASAFKMKGLSLLIQMGWLLISRADYRATSVRRRTTAHPTVVRRFLCSGYVLSRKVSCVLMNMILVTIIK
jgi:hypothetical protein